MRLLLSVSLAGFALMGACERSPQGKSDVKQSSAVDSIAVQPDSVIIQSTHRAPVDTMQRKETIVITHGSPNQAYVDSVKAAKRKTKFD
jgi:PBP1b-binding outer membrane lipoprotein LpoB